MAPGLDPFVTAVGRALEGAYQFVECVSIARVSGVPCGRGDTKHVLGFVSCCGFTCGSKGRVKPPNADGVGAPTYAVVVVVCSWVWCR